MYGKWLVISRTCLSKRNGQTSLVNIYVLDKYTKRTTKNRKNGYVRWLYIFQPLSS